MSHYSAQFPPATGTSRGPSGVEDWPSWPRTAPAIVVATSQKRKRDPRKLDNNKCAQCRHDKVKCSPQPRFWPQKCDRCDSKGFDCSEGEIKRRAKGRILPTPSSPPDLEPIPQGDQASYARHDTYQPSIEAHPGAKNEEADMYCTFLTNLVTFVQLLNHERSFLAEVECYLKNLNLNINTFAVIQDPSRAHLLDTCLEPFTREVQKILCDRQRSESVTMTDRILCENALEAVAGGFVLPRHEPISEGSLAKLPVGLQIRHLIRKLRLKIHRRGSCNLEPLDELVSHFSFEWSAWQARLGLSFHHAALLSLCQSAAYGLVVSREFLTGPLIRLWVRDWILQSGDKDCSFRIVKFAEIWNADSHYVDPFTLGRVQAGDSSRLPLLCVAVLSNKPGIVRALANHNFIPDWQPTPQDFNAFHYTASVGYVGCYRELLRYRNARTIEGKRDNNGDLPLHVAATNGHKDMVDYIISIHSDDENYVNTPNSLSETPLMRAVKSGAYDVVRFLLDCPDIDIVGSGGVRRTAISYAYNNEDILRLIVSKLPDGYFNNIARNDFETPLHHLARQAGQRAMHLVLSTPTILPDTKDRNGHTPLCGAVYSGNLEAVQALGVRRDVDVTKLSTCKLKYADGDTFLGNAKARAKNGNKHSQILDWLKRNCKELQADLAGWILSSNRRWG